MKLLMVSQVPDDPYAGTSRMFHLLNEGLSRRGHRVDLFHQGDLGLPRTRVPSLLAHRFGLPHYVSRRAMLAGPHNYDAILGTSGMLYPLYRKLARDPSAPLLIAHFMGLALFDHIALLDEAERGHHHLSRQYRLVTGPQQVRWDRASVAVADGIITLNKRDLSTVRAEAPGTPAIHIPGALHDDLLGSADHVVPPGERDPASFLWMGSWEPRKGTAYLPAAFRAIRVAEPRATLSVMGTRQPQNVIRGHFDAQDRAAITVLPLCSMQEQIRILQTHAILLFPSLSEGFGLALLEAMAMGMAALTCSTGFAADELVDHRDARIVHPSSIHIAEAAIDLVRHPDRRWALAEEGRRLALRFTADRMVAQYEAAMLEWIAAKQARHPDGGPAR